MFRHVLLAAATCSVVAQNDTATPRVTPETSQPAEIGCGMQVVSSACQADANCVWKDGACHNLSQAISTNTPAASWTDTVAPETSLPAEIECGMQVVSSACQADANCVWRDGACHNASQATSTNTPAASWTDTVAPETSQPAEVECGMQVVSSACQAAANCVWKDGACHNASQANLTNAPPNSWNDTAAPETSQPSQPSPEPSELASPCVGQGRVRCKEDDACFWKDETCYETGECPMLTVANECDTGYAAVDEELLRSCAKFLCAVVLNATSEVHGADTAMKLKCANDTVVTAIQVPLLVACTPRATAAEKMSTTEIIIAASIGVLFAVGVLIGVKKLRPKKQASLTRLEEATPWTTMSAFEVEELNFVD
ncbi:hypothetical protein DIPPA_23436 [Diplonema papillatum]|nr:hypothetical protein DIPPA_23436 [Diplonema papillatum]